MNEIPEELLARLHTVALCSDRQYAASVALDAFNFLKSAKDFAREKVAAERARCLAIANAASESPFSSDEAKSLAKTIASAIDSAALAEKEELR